MGRVRTKTSLILSRMIRVLRLKSQSLSSLVAQQEASRNVVLGERKIKVWGKKLKFDEANKETFSGDEKPNGSEGEKGLDG